MNKKRDNVKKNKGRVKKVLLLILLVIVSIIVLFFTYRFIKNKIDELNAERFSGIITEVSKDRIDYVFVEINPSFVLTVKDNKVGDVACLNDDCVSIYNDIDVKGKNINDSIDNLYNVSKQKGFETYKGVKVKISNDISIEDKEYYFEVEYIDVSEERELLKEVKNNEEIKNVSNDDYYSTLWEKLKKDPNYNDVYTCNMNDNKELECYIILETGINKDSDYNILGTSDKLSEFLGNTQNKVYNSLKKFNFDVRDNSVYINGLEFGYVPLFTFDKNGKVNTYRNALSAKKMDILDNDVCRSGYADFKDGVCQVNDGVYIIPLEKVNLVNPTSAVNNMVTLSHGLTENTLKNYELTNALAKSEREWQERVDRCLPVIESKGYYYKNNSFPCCDGTNGAEGCYSCTGREHDARYCKIMDNGDGNYESCSTLLLIFNNLEHCD